MRPHDPMGSGDIRSGYEPTRSLVVLDTDPGTCIYSIKIFMTTLKLTWGVKLKKEW